MRTRNQRHNRRVYVVEATKDVATRKVVEPASGGNLEHAQHTGANGHDDSGKQSASDDDAMQLAAPEEEVREEMRLAQERRAETANTESEAANAPKKTISERLKMLDQMLLAVSTYSEGLREQTELEVAGAGAGAVAEGGEEAKGKRKRVTGATRKGKKAKGRSSEDPGESTEASMTKKYLPLMQLELKDYQLEGVRWLSALHLIGAGGILADEMGLGKTAQTIGFFSSLWTKGIRGPFLVVAPLSTLHNWRREIERFCPTLPALVYHGNAQRRTQLRRSWLSGGAGGGAEGKKAVVLTSYEILRVDAPFFQKLHWKLLAVDEGHRIKNHNCKLIRELSQIRTDSRLLLTGTPLQNNLTELWSLLNFVLPDIFQALDDFNQWFAFSDLLYDADGQQTTMPQEQHNNAIEKLHTCLRPFLKRRIKSQVLTALPPKQEIVLWAEASPLQDQLTQRILGQAPGAAGEAAAGKPEEADLAAPRLSRSAARLQRPADRIQDPCCSDPGLPQMGQLNNMFMQLRKVCNHPELLIGAQQARETGDFRLPPLQEFKAQSGKVALLDRILDRLLPRGHKVIIFSQMVRMLELLAYYLEEKRVGHAELMGSMAYDDRQQQLTLFDTDPACKVFLLSTRAGGLGINLTAADTAILYDSDWNPQVDLQAMDRCHRIGQQRPVLVLRLATSASVEGHILQKASGKLVLERLVIQKGDFSVQEDEAAARHPLTLEELQEIVRGGQRSGGACTGGSADTAPCCVSDDVLDQLLDRSHLLDGKPPPFEAQGPGYEVVTQTTSGLLASVG